MNEWQYERYSPPGDAREQYIVTERSGKSVIRREVVVGPASYVHSYIEDQVKRAKNAPIRYRNSGVV